MESERDLELKKGIKGQRIRRKDLSVIDGAIYIKGKVQIPTSLNMPNPFS